MSRGSNTELQNQVLIAKDVNYLKEDVFNNVAQQSTRVGKLLNGLIKYCRNSRDNLPNTKYQIRRTTYHIPYTKYEI